MVRSVLIRCLAVSVALALAAPMVAAKKKKKGEEEVTQTLEVVPDPPNVIKAEVGRMVFHTAPLSGKGLLSQQVRDAVKAIWRVNGGATVVKLRALVAGTGDLRRVQAIVSEMFAEKRQPLPVLSVVQVGVLAMEGAQVVLEATSLAKKTVNPHGLAFVSGKGATKAINADQPSTPLMPLAEKSVADLKTALRGVGLAGADVQRVTCFQSALDEMPQVQGLVAREFPSAVLTFAQTERAPSIHVVECEAVARLKSPAGAPWKVMNPDGLPASPAFSQLAVAGPGPVVLSGGHLAFRAQDSDVRLCFERLQKHLEESGTNLKNVFWSGIYPTSRGITERVRAIRFEYYDKANPPASTVLGFEGLPSLDATFSLEVIAGVR